MKVLEIHVENGDVFFRGKTQDVSDMAVSILKKIKGTKRLQNKLIKLTKEAHEDVNIKVPKEFYSSLHMGLANSI